MPSKSAKQKRLMQAACHNKEFADKVNVPQSVACEFEKEDKKVAKKKVWTAKAKKEFAEKMRKAREAKRKSNPAKTVELKPTQQGYINMLKMIMESSTVKKDRDWARKELEKAGVIEKKKPAKKKAKKNPSGGTIYIYVKEFPHNIFKVMATTVRSKSGTVLSEHGSYNAAKIAKAKKIQAHNASEKRSPSKHPRKAVSKPDMRRKKVKKKPAKRTSLKSSSMTGLEFGIAKAMYANFDKKEYSGFKFLHIDSKGYGSFTKTGSKMSLEDAYEYRRVLWDNQEPGVYVIVTYASKVTDAKMLLDREGWKERKKRSKK